MKQPDVRKKSLMKEIQKPAWISGSMNSGIHRAADGHTNSTAADAIRRDEQLAKKSKLSGKKTEAERKSDAAKRTPKMPPDSAFSATSRRTTNTSRQNRITLLNQIKRSARLAKIDEYLKTPSTAHSRSKRLADIKRNS